MRKLIIFLLLLITVPVYASPPSRTYTYVTGTTIEAAHVMSNEDEIFNYLQLGVDTYADNTLVNADVKTTAGIISSKLDLSSITQDITHSGTFTQSGGSTFSGSNTFSGNSTFLGTTIANLGTVTTASFTAISDLGDVATTGTIALGGGLTCGSNAVTGSNFTITGGSMTGVQIGEASATGELLINNASDNVVGLNSQGTSGQFLQSQGAGANPAWANQGLTYISHTTFSNATVTDDISISQGSKYMALIYFRPEGEQAVRADLRFNSDSGSHYASTGEAVGDATEIDMQSAALHASSTVAFYYGVLYLDTVFTDRMVVRGHSTYVANGPALTGAGIHGYWDNSATVTSFELVFLNGNAATGEVYLYKISEE